MLSADTNNKSSGLYTCQTCNSIFTCLNYYQKHRQQHAENEGVKLMTCSHCTYVSDNGFHFNWHIMSHGSLPPHRCDVCDASSANNQSIDNNEQSLEVTKTIIPKCTIVNTPLSTSSSSPSFSYSTNHSKINFNDSNQHTTNSASNNNELTNRISQTILSSDGKCRSIATETDDDLILESQLYSPTPADADDNESCTIFIRKNPSQTIENHHDNYDTRQFIGQNDELNDNDDDDNATIIDESCIDDNDHIVQDDVNNDGDNEDEEDDETEEDTDIDDDSVPQQQSLSNLNGHIIEQQEFYNNDNDNLDIDEEEEEEDDENDVNSGIILDQSQCHQEYNNENDYHLTLNGYDNDNQKQQQIQDCEDEENDDEQPQLIDLDEDEDDEEAEDEENLEDVENIDDNIENNNRDMQMMNDQMSLTSQNQIQQSKSDVYDFNSDEDLDQLQTQQLKITSKSFNLLSNQQLSSANQHQTVQALQQFQPKQFLDLNNPIQQHQTLATHGLPPLHVTTNPNVIGNQNQRPDPIQQLRPTPLTTTPATTFTIAHPNFLFPNVTNGPALLATAAQARHHTTISTTTETTNATIIANNNPQQNAAAATNIFNHHSSTTFTAANGQMVQLVSLQPFPSQQTATPGSLTHTGQTQFLQAADCQLNGISASTLNNGLSLPSSCSIAQNENIELPTKTKTSKKTKVSKNHLVPSDSVSKKTPRVRKSIQPPPLPEIDLAIPSPNGSLSPTELAERLGSAITKIVSPSDYKPMKGRGKGNRKPRISFISVVNGITLGSDGIRRKFQCSHCGNGKSFKTKSHLQRHMLTHTGEKPYQCQECGAKFNQSSSLRNHMIAIHTRRFPHTCTTCGKGFLMPAVLQKHITNTGHHSEITLKDDCEQFST